MPTCKLCILVGAAVAYAGSTTGSATCSGSACTSCVSADGSLGGVTVCVNFTAPSRPTCTCTTMCSMEPCSSNCSASCSICVPSVIPTIGTCVDTTQATGYILGSSSSLDFGLSAALGTTFDGQTLVTVDSSASANVSGSGLVKLASSAAIDTLVIGGGLITTAMVDVSTSTNVNVWTNNAAKAKVENNCSSLVVGTLAVGGASFSLYQGCPKANVTINSLDFSARAGLSANAKLLIAGGVARINADGSGNVIGTGNVSLSGGVAIEGHLPASVTVEVRAASNAPLISIDASKEFHVAGDMTADAAGTVAVFGKLAFGAATANVQPKVIVNGGATLVFNSSSNCQAKALEIAASGTLEIGANVKASTLALGQFAKCLGAVKIHLATTASAFVSGSSAGTAVAFTYTGGNPTELSKCAVQVVDSTGAVITLTSRTSVSGRRLLQSGGSATWSDSSMTYTMGQQQANGAFVYTLAPALVGFLALLA